jgi:8-oxo-dGTP diphosphatase/2-hydroxy-dATP diphosphatase
MRILLTLCLIHQHPRILLGMKKRGFGAGRWNGFGGKIAPGESIEEAAVRELREETGVEADPMDLEQHGILEFEFQNDPGKVLEVHVFKVHNHTGEPVETEEMRPKWFFVDEIPFKDMWSDDPYWIPLFIKGRKFRGRFVFDQPLTADQNARIIDKHMQIVTNFD